MPALRVRLLCLFVLMFPAVAFAYVDPGSGMLMWQGLVAAVGAVLVFLRNPVEVIKRWIERLRNK